MKKNFVNSQEVMRSILSAIIIITAVFAVYSQNATAKLTAAQWQSDIKFLSEEMPKRHKNLFHAVKREDFEAAVKQLYDKVPAMNDDEILTGLMKIVAMVGDGHTYMLRRGSAYQTNNFYPVKFYLFQNGLFVRQAAPEYAAAVGNRVVKINGLKTEGVLETVGSLIARDNEWGVKEDAATYLSIPEILGGLKIGNDKQKMILTIESGGKETNIEIKASASADEFRRPPDTWKMMNAAARNTIPLYQKNPNDIFWFEYIKDKKLLYVQQNAVADKESETVADFYKRVTKFVESNDVEKLVVDLRFNGGGNNYLNRPVVIELIKSKLNERGKLFVITGRRTFSAAQNLVNEIEKYTNAIFVGEPTAANPNHYGDPVPINLPNSKLSVRVSTLWWQDFDPRDSRRWTSPEVAAEVSSENYGANVDPALEEIINYKRPATTYGEFRQELRRQLQSSTAQDISVFVKKYREFKDDPRHKFVGETESLLNDFGYLLIDRKRFEDAVAVLKLNTEYYPNSANALDSLGEAYLAAGKKDEAIRTYEKAITIDPNLKSSLDALKRLKGE